MVLNGWQRLWVVLSLLGLLIPFKFYVKDFPTSGKFRSEKVSQIYQIDENIDYLKNKIDSSEDKKKSSSGVVRWKIYELDPRYKDMSIEQKIEFSKDKIHRLEDEKKSIEKTYENKIENINKYQASFIFKLLTFWVVLSFGVYLVFWCALRLSLWVYSGFKNKQ
jgi:hypothetical protein